MTVVLYWQSRRRLSRFDILCIRPRAQINDKHRQSPKTVISHKVCGALSSSERRSVRRSREPAEWTERSPARPVGSRLRRVPDVMLRYASVRAGRRTHRPRVVSRCNSGTRDAPYTSVSKHTAFIAVLANHWTWIKSSNNQVQVKSKSTSFKSKSKSLIAICIPVAKKPIQCKSADLKSLDYVVVGSFMKIFKSKSKEIAICCMEMFNCPLPSVSVNNRRSKFLLKFSVSENIVCRL